MSDPDDADASIPPSEPRDAALGSGNGSSWLTPYLIILLLGVVAALLVAVQLWPYQDELRSLLSGPAV